MNLNDFAKEVHENAIAHGWWDEERSDGTLRALMHAELSEALEEYRANRPMVWHACKLGGMCETQEVHQGDIGCDNCTPQMRKPEGVAVELIDFCIRTLDWLAQRDAWFKDDSFTIEKLVKHGCKMLSKADCEWIRTMKLPDLVDILHALTTDCGQEDDYINECCAMGVVFLWLTERNVDAEAIMLEKHEYNKSRPYMHGGKVC